MEQEAFFSRLLEQLENQLPLVVYRKPESRGPGKVKAFLQQDSRCYTVTDYSESGFVFAPFDDSREAVLIPEGKAEVLELSEEGEELSAESGSGRKESPEQASGVAQEARMEAEREKHVGLVARGVEALKAGKMEKVVLSRREEVELEGRTPLGLFRELLASYPRAFVYCWYHPQVGLWLGATPETLVQLQGNSFKTMALAGTQNYEGTLEVSWGEKEMQEQQYVTDSIVENLRSLEVEPQLVQPDAATKIGEEGAYTSRAGNLLHLRTDISGRIPGAEGVRRIVEALHPTPAVCGLPKKEAREFILREEAHDREFYTGFLGELNLQEVKARSRNRRNVENLAYAAVRRQSSLFVNLRCMKLEAGKAVLFVGGGITRDSVPEDEWQETRNKAQTMKRVLGE